MPKKSQPPFMGVPSHVAHSTWDPLASCDWNQTPVSATMVKRLARDLDQLYTRPPTGIFARPDETESSLVHALVVGPFDTPYEGGPFYFVLRLPPDYPLRPPRVRLMTTGGGAVRFNPNLYADGKVCLSILGTWTGPSWTAAQTLESVLLSIQSLMCAKPYHNEPGFHAERSSGDSNRYNDVIAYETLRTAVCHTLEMCQDSASSSSDSSATSGSRTGTGDVLSGTTTPYKRVTQLCQPRASRGAFMPADLLDVVRSTFATYYDSYMNTLEALEKKRLHGQPYQDPFHSNKGVYDLVQLRQRLLKLAELYNEPSQQGQDQMDTDCIDLSMEP